MNSALSEISIQVRDTGARNAASAVSADPLVRCDRVHIREPGRAELAAGDHQSGLTQGTAYGDL